MHIFTYGSLMFAPVWRRVVRGSYSSAPALLADHARLAIRGETYPGMVARAGAQVEGVLYFDVTPDDVDALDAFEGIEYRRQALQVALASGATATAHAYLYLPAHRLSSLPWRPEAFEQERFIAAFCGETRE